MDRGNNPAHASNSPAETIADLVAKRTGSTPLNCYQCGRCAAGCPQNVPGEMDISPTRIMHLLQLESAFAQEKQKADAYARQVLGADTPWLCAGCMACTTRCPQQVDIAGTMDVLRQESLRRGMTSTSKRTRDVIALHRSLLNAALNHGRVHEMSLVMAYKLRTGHLLQDALLGLPMFLKGKLHVLPEERPDPSRVRNAAQQMAAQEEGKRA